MSEELMLASKILARIRSEVALAYSKLDQEEESVREQESDIACRANMLAQIAADRAELARMLAWAENIYKEATEG